jgi:hypothetical protein
VQIVSQLATQRQCAWVRRDKPEISSDERILYNSGWQYLGPQAVASIA